MRVLLTTQNFAAFAGTETYTLTVARELERLGHDVMIYSPNPGAMSEHARRQGVRVVDGAGLPEDRELAIFSDTATCHELAGHYARAVRIFVAHSADFPLQAPPQLADSCHVVVVLNDRVRRALEARSWHPRIVRLRQPVDLLRYRNLGSPRSPATTVLVVSNALKGPRAAMIEEASRAAGLQLNWIGMTSTPTGAPELALAGADIVIGLGRSVIEAMAAGRPAYVYGVAGGDGWVTREQYPSLEADGFAGTSARELVIDPGRLAEDLRANGHQLGEINRDLASAHHGAQDHAISLVELARTLDSSPPVASAPGDELAHLVRLEMHNLERIWSAQAEIERLRALMGEREEELRTVHDELAAATEQLASAKEAARTGYAALAAIRDTRRYRFACRIAAPLDRLRGR